MTSAINLTRGDSDTITVSMKDDFGVQIPFQTGDTVYLTVKTDTSTATKVFQKVVTSFTSGNAIINIVPSDTKSLEYGVYVYDIQWNQSSGTITTLVKPSQFVVGQEVTYE